MYVVFEKGECTVLKSPGITICMPNHLGIDKSSPRMQNPLQQMRRVVRRMSRAVGEPSMRLVDQKTLRILDTATTSEPAPFREDL